MGSVNHFADLFIPVSIRQTAKWISIETITQDRYVNCEQLKNQMSYNGQAGHWLTPNVVRKN